MKKKTEIFLLELRIKLLRLLKRKKRAGGEKKKKNKEKNFLNNKILTED
jgi:hypothetical protein